MAELRARFEYRYRDAGNYKGEGCGEPVMTVAELLERLRERAGWGRW